MAEILFLLVLAYELQMNVYRLKILSWSSLNYTFSIYLQYLDIVINFENNLQYLI